MTTLNMIFFLLKKKFEALDAFKAYKAEVEN